MFMGIISRRIDSSAGLQSTAVCGRGRSIVAEFLHRALGSPMKPHQCRIIAQNQSASTREYCV